MEKDGAATVEPAGGQDSTEDWWEKAGGGKEPPKSSGPGLDRNGEWDQRRKREGRAKSPPEPLPPELLPPELLPPGLLPPELLPPEALPVVNENGAARLREESQAAVAALTRHGSTRMLGEGTRGPRADGGERRVERRLRWE